MSAKVRQGCEKLCDSLQLSCIATILTPLTRLHEATRPLLMPQPPILSSRGLTLLFVAAFVLPLTALTVYAVLFGRASDRPLPVNATIDRRPVTTLGGEGAVMHEVVVLRSEADFDIPRLTVDLNGQYFLHRQSPLKAGEELILPQQIFATKSNQRFVPGRYPITEINVTGRLPSGARGVAEFQFEQ